MQATNLPFLPDVYMPGYGSTDRCLRRKHPTPDIYDDLSLKRYPRLIVLGCKED